MFDAAQIQYPIPVILRSSALRPFMMTIGGTSCLSARFGRLVEISFAAGFLPCLINSGGSCEAAGVVAFWACMLEKVNGNKTEMPCLRIDYE